MPPTVRVLPDQLASYFDGVTKQFFRDVSTDAVTVELISPEIGDQFALQGAHLNGITFDPRSNALEFAFDAGTHRIYAPREVWSEEAPDGFPRSIEVVRPDGTREVAIIQRLGLERVD
jgi:Family of unknown function (DUF5335)